MKSLKIEEIWQLPSRICYTFRPFQSVLPMRALIELFQTVAPSYPTRKVLERFRQLELAFATKSVRRLCKNKNLASKTLGPKNASFLHARLADIEAAENATVLKALAGLFELDDETGKVQTKLDTFILLSAIPGHLEVPYNSRGKIDWQEVVRLQVLEIGGKQ